MMGVPTGGVGLKRCRQCFLAELIAGDCEAFRSRYVTRLERTAEITQATPRNRPSSRSDKFIPTRELAAEEGWYLVLHQLFPVLSERAPMFVRVAHVAGSRS